MSTRVKKNRREYNRLSKEFFDTVLSNKFTEAHRLFAQLSLIDTGRGHRQRIVSIAKHLSYYEAQAQQIQNFAGSTHRA